MRLFGFVGLLDRANNRGTVSTQTHASKLAGRSTGQSTGLFQLHPSVRIPPAGMRYLADFPNVAQFLPRIQHCIHNTQLFDDLFRIVLSPLRPYQDVSFTDLYRRDTPITAEPVFGGGHACQSLTHMPARVVLRLPGPVNSALSHRLPTGRSFLRLRPESVRRRLRPAAVPRWAAGADRSSGR